MQSLEKKDNEYIENLRGVLERSENYSMFSYKKGGGHVTSAVPLYDSTGKPCAIVSVYKPMHEIREYKQKFLKSIIIWALAVTAIFIALYALLLYLGIIRPILFVTYETSHFAEHHGELSGILKKIHGHNEISTLAKSVEKMSTDMNRYIEDLTHATAEKERLGAELNVAKQIQAEMLPRVFPPYENHKEIELFASMEPAKEVGGDFYDFYMIDDDHFAVVVGDVSGKGVPAALFMVITKTLLKDTAAHQLDPAKIFENVNTILCENNESGLFVTCWMGILTLSTGELKFANAGHNAPLILQNGECKYLTTKPNLMLAGMDGVKYSANEIKLSPGDQLFLYTDGVTEAKNGADAFYGEERLKEVINAHLKEGPTEIVKSVGEDVASFVGEAEQFDDITMLSIRMNSYQGNNVLHTMVREGVTEEAIEYLEKRLRRNSFSEKTINKINIITDEIVSNIAKYSGAVYCEISMAYSPQELTLEYIDDGVPYNPLEEEEPDINVPADERRIGGLGLFMVKKMSKEMSYARKGNKNILHVKVDYER